MRVLPVFYTYYKTFSDHLPYFAHFRFNRKLHRLCSNKWKTAKYSDSILFFMSKTKNVVYVNSKKINMFRQLNKLIKKN